jgi:hypothetical protein
MGKWSKARAAQQVFSWFGCVPDFVLTFYAEHALNCSDLEWCALVEHELLHCAQAVDAYGEGKFLKDGTPMYSIRAHDVNEFVSIVRRYGAFDPKVQAMVEASKRPPEVGSLSVSEACGTCQRAA